MDKSLTVIDRLAPKEIALIKETYAKDLNDQEFNLFMAQAKAMNLNPFTKEIYGIKAGGRLVLMTSIAGLRKIAHASGKYLGCRVDVTEKEGKIFSATATVKKLVGVREAEFQATVLLDEYAGNTPNWKDKPRTMLAKTAEAHALRMAFPSLEGLFEQAETTNLPADTFEPEPAPELETQTFPEDVPIVGEKESTIDIPDPGAHMLKLAKNNYVSKRVDKHTREELLEFVSWCYSKSTLNPVVKEGLLNVEAFLKRTERE